MTDEPTKYPDVAELFDKLASIQSLIDRVVAEPRVPAATVIQRYREDVYRAMFELGAAIHRFELTDPAPERLTAARAALVNLGRLWFPTHPMMAAGQRRPGRRLAYYELVELILASLAAAAEPAPVLLSDYAINSVIGQTFRNRLALIASRLREEVDARQAAGHRPLQLYSLHYLGGSELLHLTDDSRRLDGLRVTCLDASPAAIRHAEQTLEPAFKRRISFQMADPERWLSGPACPRQDACIVYCVSLLEQVDSKSALAILRGAYELLRDGGVLLMGSVTDTPPIEEQRLRAWVLSWDWHYRSEREWRDLFAQTPFRAEDVTWEYEPVGAGLVIRARR
jgi:hypothetical protein